MSTPHARRKQLMAEREAELRERGEWDDETNGPKARSGPGRKKGTKIHRRNRQSELDQPGASSSASAGDQGTNSGLDMDDNMMSAGMEPLAAPPVRREYSAPKIDESMEALPAPNIAQQSMQNSASPVPGTEGSGQSGPNSGPDSGMAANGPVAPPPPLNPVMNELDDKDKRVAAELAVGFLLDAYDDLLKIAPKMVQVPEQKLMEMHMDGEIDVQTKVPIDEDGSEVTIHEFVTSFNKQAEVAFMPSREFREDMEPPLTRIFIKRGIGMTDENYVIFRAGKEIAVQFGKVIALRRDIRNALKMFSKVHVYDKGQQQETPPPPASSSTPPPPPPPPPPQSPFTGPASQAPKSMAINDESTSSIADLAKPEQPIYYEAEEVPNNDSDMLQMESIPYEESVNGPRQYPEPKIESETTIKSTEV